MSRGLQWLNLVACCVLGATIACWMAVEIWPAMHLVSVVQAQGNIKTVIIDPPHRNDPIEVVKVLIAGKAAVLGVPTADDMRGWIAGGYLPGMKLRDAYKLPADDKWTESLSFVLRNRTSEKIASVEIELQTHQAGWIRVPQFSFGQLPAAAAYFGDGKPIPQTGEPMAFNPCGEMTFALADDRVGLAQLRDLPEVSQVYPRLRVYLEDGLVWLANFYSRPDPERPGQWLSTPGPYFPPNGLPGPAMKRPTRAQLSSSCSQSSTREGGLSR